MLEKWIIGLISCRQLWSIWPMCGALIDLVIKDSLNISVFNHTSIILMDELLIDYIINVMLCSLYALNLTTDIDDIYFRANSLLLYKAHIFFLLVALLCRLNKVKHWLFLACPVYYLVCVLFEKPITIRIIGQTWQMCWTQTTHTFTHNRPSLIGLHMSMEAVWWCCCCVSAQKTLWLWGLQDSELKPFNRTHFHQTERRCLQ